MRNASRNKKLDTTRNLFSERFCLVLEAVWYMYIIAVPWFVYSNFVLPVAGLNHDDDATFSGVLKCFTRATHSVRRAIESLLSSFRFV